VKPLKTIIFTGVSGAGKTTALRAVEDLGFYCVDNLPLPLLGEFIETMLAEPQVDRAALVVDARLRNYIEGYALANIALRSSGIPVEVVYLDARDDELIRRFSQTRRRHPLGGDDLVAGLREERQLLALLRAQAATCIDTSELTVHQLKQLVQDRYATEGTKLVLSLLSFGFRHGVPSHADLVFDVRFLPNPFFVDALRHLSGLDKTVAGYVLEAKECPEFLDRLEGLLRFLLPRYEAEGKVYLTVAVGCTGGRHRSVAIAEDLARRLGGAFLVRVRHRDVGRGEFGP
jgi:UPF0042 nucleotide-binding protein